MLDARIYRAALIPVLLAAIVCAFSLQDRPAPITTTLAPDAFSGSRTAGQLADLAEAFPVRRPGGPADGALAARIAAELRSMGPFEVSTARFRGETIDGERPLTTVMARQVGAPGPELVIVAHRDAAARGAQAELSGTAVMLELARVVAGGRLRRTVTFVSTSGGSGGAAGARDLAERLAGPIDAILVLGDMTAGTERAFAANWSESSSLGPVRLQRTVEAAVREEAGRRPDDPSSFTQWTRIAFPGALGEQGPLIAAGLPAVLLSASGERPPPAGGGRGAGGARLSGFGRAALRSLVALDEGPDLRARPARQVVTVRKVLPSWAARLLIGALLLAPILATIDGFARVRRRRLPVSPWLGWIAAGAAPFALAAAFATVLGLTGLLAATPPGPVPAGTIPVDGPARAALIATALAGVLAVVGRPLLLRAIGAQRGFDGPGAGTALLLVWCALAAGLWILNPFAAAFMVPAAHLWLLLAAPGVRVRRGVALMIVALSLAPFALAALVLAGQAGLGPLDFAWAALLSVAGGHVGPLAWLFWSAAAGCAAGAVVLAWRSRRPEREPDGRVTVRGPISYAGPGSLGGTESALRY
jgi:hypothetical protein